MLRTIRLTAAQALVRYLAAQLTEEGAPFIAGVWAIFGHGNVAGMGEALHASRDVLPTYRGHNEQTMAHAAIAYAKQSGRKRAMAVTSSIGPGAANMVTAAALAHVNRLPVLLIPGDVFATRGPDPVLQQIEDFQDGTATVNDAFRPLTRYFDRITRQWVEEMFRLEAEDIAMIENPRAKVIDKGGTILFVEDPELGIIGTCALMPMEDGGVELTKMGVLASARGRRAGDFLMRQILKRARQMEIQDLFLLTNSKCASAIRLYEKYGFRHDEEIMRRYGHRYERCNITMSYAMPAAQ